MLVATSLEQTNRQMDKQTKNLHTSISFKQELHFYLSKNKYSDYRCFKCDSTKDKLSKVTISYLHISIQSLSV